MHFSGSYLANYLIISARILLPAVGRKSFYIMVVWIKTFNFHSSAISYALLPLCCNTANTANTTIKNVKCKGELMICLKLRIFR